ncbi:MAG: LamG-like jellyroll fold domain-containing protein [Kiritimatiellia bacterium]
MSQKIKRWLKVGFAVGVLFTAGTTAAQIDTLTTRYDNRTMPTAGGITNGVALGMGSGIESAKRNLVFSSWTTKAIASGTNAIHFQTTVGAPVAAVSANTFLGQIIDPPVGAVTGTEPIITLPVGGGTAVWIDYAGIVIATGTGQLEIEWEMIAGGTETKYYTVSVSSAKRPVRMYWTHKRPESAYGNDTSLPLQNAGPTIQFGNNYRVDLYGNNAIEIYSVDDYIVGDVRLNGTELYAFEGARGSFLLTYSRLDELSGRRELLAYEIVDVMEPMSTEQQVDIGDQLKPLSRPFSTDALFPQVTRGMVDESGRNEIYVYQHMTGPQKDWLYAIRDTVDKAWKIEVYWRAKEELDVLWPFEVDIYEAAWGTNATLYARDAINNTPNTRADPKVRFPANLAVSAMSYQVPAAHVVVENNAFYTTACGNNHYALMKYTSGDLVWFETIASRSGTDASVYTGQYQQDIPEIITPPFVESDDGFFYPGWIKTIGTVATPVRNPYNINTYSYPTAYTATNLLNSSIFPVNAGVLNVYWSLPSRCNNAPQADDGYVEPLPAPLFIPGVTADYLARFPSRGQQQSETATQIVIASGQGSIGATLNDFAAVRGAVSSRKSSTPNGIMKTQLHGGVPSDEFTFEAWLKIDTASTEVELIRFTHPDEATTNSLFTLAFDKGDLLLNSTNLTQWGSFPVQYNPHSYNLSATEKWHHVAVAKTADGLLSYYLNGYLAAQFENKVLPAVDFGNDLAELFSSGNIAFDNIRLWSSARSWKQLYQGRYKPAQQPDSTLAAQYLCDALWDEVAEEYRFPMYGYLQDSAAFDNHLPFPAEESPAHFSRTADAPDALPHVQPGMDFGGGDAALYVQRDRTRDGYNPNEEHAMLMSGIAFALRTDLNNTNAATPATYSSEPFALLQYTDPDTGKPFMKALQVVPENDMYRFTGFMEAGQMVQAPIPISLLQPANWHDFVSGPVLADQTTCFRDRKDWFWAQQAGDDGGHANYVFDFSYPNQPGFDYPGATTLPEAGARIPWMPGYTGRGDGFPVRDSGDLTSTPINYTFHVLWPETVPGLYVGDTLTTPKNGLPAVRGQLSANVLYQQSLTQVGALPSVHLIDPTQARKTAMEVVPGALDSYRDVRTAYTLFSDLPPMLRERIYWNPMAEKDSEFQLKGQFRERTDGHNYLLLNVMDERSRLSALDPEIVTGADDPDWVRAINALPRGANDLVRIIDDETPFDSLALSTDGRGAGYVTIVFNDSLNEDMVDPSESIFMNVIKVEPELYQGRLDPILSDNPLDKQMNLKYTADFGGSTERWEYEWHFANPDNGSAPAMDSEEWFALRDSEGDSYLDFATIGDAGVFGLSDHYVRCRYRANSNALDVIALVGTNWASWTPPQLAEGWIKRVLKAINPFEQRIRDYMNVELNTQLSMLQQAGSPYNGNVPLNMEALNDYGLIPIYETLLRESKKLSIDADNPSAGALSLALQMAAGRISELFMVLGNEAMADAMSPTIDLGNDSPIDDGAQSSIFAFQNQTRNLLEEELALLRGRDLSWEYAELPPQSIEPTSYPLFNRLAWNFTADIMGGEVAYALNYGITDLKGNNDGSLNAKDAEMLFPQGHGDAYGHYLSAIKGYYYLLRHPSFGWLPQVEGVLAGETEITISYFHEKRFVMAAAAKAKTAEMVVSRTWRDAYQHGEEDSWMLAEDEVDNRDWGIDEWATRGHLGAYYDWAVANALLPSRESDELGIRIIDREGTPELGEITVAARRIQRIADQADTGMNPLGLADNAIPFDISPSEIDEGKTHFEQIQRRALRALDNAAEVYGRVKSVGNALRDQNESRDFDTMVADEEAALHRRLIEVYGYPYADDIGPGKNYAQGYNGPDLLNYRYVELYDLDNNLDVHGRYYNMTLNRYATAEETITGSFQAEIDTTVGDLGIIGNAVAGAITFTQDKIGQGVNYLNQWVDLDEPQLPVTIIDTGTDAMDGLVNYTFNVTSWTNMPVDVRYYVSPYGFPGKPPEFTGQRRAEGEIQIALAGYAEQLFAIQQAYENAAARTESVRSQIEALRAFEFGNQVEIPIKYANAEVAAFYAAAKANAQAVADSIAMLGKVKDYITESGVEAFPKMAGFSTDFTSLGRAAVLALRAGVEETLGLQVSDQKRIITEIDAKVKSIEEQMEAELAAARNSPERSRMLSEIRKAAHEVGAAVAALESTLNLANATRMRFVALESEGDQLQMERERLRLQWSSDLNTRRYRNMMYQIMRNDALQRYNEAFETAARYCYLAARAYDYETGMLSSDSENTAGRDFMTQIVKTRSLGRFVHDANGYGAPLGGGAAGDPGLADVMYRLDENWQVLKGRLGFNNPQSDVDAFSLRRELFRKVPDVSGDPAWKAVLTAAWVANLRDLPVFQRHCLPFDPMAVTEPGFAIPFSTTIEFRKNFFGQDLAAGDNAFDSTYFSTKLRGIGVCLDGGSAAVNGLALRPQIYIVPAGLDAMRVPIRANGTASSLRTWSVLDQVLPLPYPLAQSQWEDPDWSALKNLCGNELFAIRKYPSLRAYLGDGFNPLEMRYNARLIGRSVWNSEWWIIIPAGSLNANDTVARTRFIDQIKDIKLYLQTYSFSGN